MKTYYPYDDREFLRKLDALIAEHLTMEGLSVAFLADRMCMSLSTFFRRVKTATGIGGNEYIRGKRLAKVVIKLTNARRGGVEMAISEAAFACGFSSLSAFDKAFRKQFGITPTEYMKEAEKTSDRRGL